MSFTVGRDFYGRSLDEPRVLGEAVGGLRRREKTLGGIDYLEPEPRT